MKCTIQGCPGEYEDKDIVHTVRHEGKVVVIDHVPAEECSVCGDVLLKPETVEHIEKLLKETTRKPCGTAPMYEYA